MLTVNVYAVFDRPGEDQLVAVSSTPNSPLTIEVIDGEFFQHSFGTDQPPSGALVAAFPSLAYDTFITIGVKCVGDPPCQPADNLVVTPNLPFRDSALVCSQCGWAVTPNNPQGNPFHPDTFPGNGKVLIGQYSTQLGTAIQGTMMLQYISNGVTGQSVESFFCSSSCTSDEQCTDFNLCTGIETCVDGVCQAGPIQDCNGNGLHDACDIADGTSMDSDGDGVPDECVVCRSDLDGDGSVGIVDFLILLGDWGRCP